MLPVEAQSGFRSALELAGLAAAVVGEDVEPLTAEALHEHHACRRLPRLVHRRQRHRVRKFVALRRLREPLLKQRQRVLRSALYSYHISVV